MNFERSQFFASQHRHLGSSRSSQDKEMDRVLGIPIRHVYNDSDAELYSMERMRVESFSAGERINKYQCALVRDYLEHGGVFGSVGAGAGKTLAAFLMANEAYQRGLKKILYLIPASTAMQTAGPQLQFARYMVWLQVPHILMSGAGRQQRDQYAKSNSAGMYTLNFSQLSLPDTNDVLAAIKPELVIVDEAHRLKNRRAALTKRVFAMLEAFQPQVVVMSGSFSSKGIKEIHHHLVAALGQKAPVPMSYTATEHWAEHLDSTAFGALPVIPPSVQPLVAWAVKNFPTEEFKSDTSSIRKAFRLRLQSSPGVVASNEQSSNASLIIQNMPVDGLQQRADWKEVDELCRKVDEGISPSGDVIEHAIHGFRHRWMLQSGFFYKLSWPTTEHLLRYRVVESAEEAAERLEKSKYYFQREQQYRKLLRAFLKVSALGLDTPMDVGRSIKQHGALFVPEELVEAHAVMEAADFPGRLERLSTPVYLSDARYPAMLQWVAERPKDDIGGIVWYFHHAVGRRCYELLQKAGADTIYCPAGPDANALILNPEHENKIVVASMKAHSEGKNLQHWGSCYLMQPPRDANLTEQMLARTHRQGQLREEITITTNLTTQTDHEIWAAMLVDSVYAQQTLGQQRRVVTATYDPLPRIISPEYLNEKGLEVKTLNPEQREAMKRYFGKEFES